MTARKPCMLALSGNGWPPQALSQPRACACVHSNFNVASSGATGSTFRLISVMQPKVPMAPTMSLETS